MIAAPAMGSAINPLWWFTASVAGAAALGSWSPQSGSITLGVLLPIVGSSAVVAALAATGSRRTLLLVLAGLSLGGWRGLDTAADVHELRGLVDADPPAAVRVRVTTLEGWTRRRWGVSTTVRVEGAVRGGMPLELPRRSRLEVRAASDHPLPRPGTTLSALAALRGDPEHLLLVVASDRLLEPLRDAHGLPALRNALASSLVESAGTDPSRIRAAELAGALALGRRDLVPRHRRDGWRQSGLGHALAVSGLHVGVVAGVAWLAAIACGLGPLTARLLLLAAVPAYVLLAGASPSAIRAGIMITVFLMSRLIGRAALALGAVLLTATLMILLDPGLVYQAGFQLTVGVTAALIRWAPRFAQMLRGPSWLAAAASIPIVAQIAAMPVVAAHFRAITPLAAIANLGVPILLTPSIPVAVASTAAAGLWQPAAAPLLDLLGAMTDLLWRLGSVGRFWTVTAPALPTVAAVLFAAFGMTALRLDRFGRTGMWLWIGLMGFIPVSTFANRSQPNRVELLDVDDGLAAMVSTDAATVAFDGGRFRTQAAEHLADAGIRSLDMVFVSHGDEDHVGGVAQILRSIRVDTLAVPEWLVREEPIADVLRTAHRRGTRIVPVATGSTLRSGRTRVDVLWPPADADATLSDNDRSLVVRVVWPAGSVLLTGDIGARVETTIATASNVACEVLVVPHHGSRTSSTAAFLSAVNPRVALIPAGAKNRHHHPHPEAVGRLSARFISVRAPILDGKAGARREPDGWAAWP